MLKDKVVIITGGCGLLGKALTKGVLENHGVAVIGDRDRDAGSDMIHGLGQGKGSIDFIQLDINSTGSVRTFIQSVSDKYKKIDALVNSAYPRNRNYGRKFHDVTYEDFCENLSLHLGGYFLMSQQMSEFFLRQGDGNIINISSIYGVCTPKFDIYEETEMTMPVEYAAIKSAVIHLTRYMARYFKGKNIRVNSVSPGGLLDKQPQSFLDRYRSYCLDKGMLEPNDVIGTIIFLLSDMSRYINGQNIIVDDGWTL